jgi:toxin YoeB
MEEQQKKYKVLFTKKAELDIRKHYKSDDAARNNKLQKLIIELEYHPRQGTGKVEQLKTNGQQELWSRRIDGKHRIVYSIHDDIITVIIISAYGHYGDK